MTIKEIIEELKKEKDLYKFNSFTGEEATDEDSKNKVKILALAINTLERLR